MLGKYQFWDLKQSPYSTDATSGIIFITTFTVCRYFTHETLQPILLLFCLRCSSHCSRRDTQHTYFSFSCCHKCWFHFIRLMRDMITISVGVWRFTIRNIFPSSFSYCFTFVFSYSLVFSYFFIFLLFCVTSSSFL